MRRTKKKVLDEAADDHIPDAEFQAGPTETPDASSGIDRLEYLADIIGELRTLTASLGCPALTGILDVARSEAHQEISRRADVRLASEPDSGGYQHQGAA